MKLPSAGTITRDRHSVSLVGEAWLWNEARRKSKTGWVSREVDRHTKRTKTESNKSLSSFMQSYASKPHSSTLHILSHEPSPIHRKGHPSLHRSFVDEGFFVVGVMRSIISSIGSFLQSPKSY